MPHLLPIGYQAFHRFRLGVTSSAVAGHDIPQAQIDIAERSRADLRSAASGGQSAVILRQRPGLRGKTPLQDAWKARLAIGADKIAAQPIRAKSCLAGGNGMTPRGFTCNQQEFAAEFGVRHGCGLAKNAPGSGDPAVRPVTKIARAAG